MNTNIITTLPLVENKTNRVFMDASKHAHIIKHLKYIVCLLALLACIPMLADYSEAELNKVRSLADQGDVFFQYELGQNYYLGRNGLKENYTEAAKWFRKAADQGHSHAQYSLGWMYASVDKK